jgi:hypothetical protein
VRRIASGVSGPVGEQEERYTLAMAVGPIGRKLLLERHLELGALATPLDERGVGGDAVEPAAERGAPLEASIRRNRVRKTSCTTSSASASLRVNAVGDASRAVGVAGP